tara:strand:- start:13585 stop:15828 length:2244 start_codon:yes stop_codon:yes gene_type:complete
MLKFKLPFVLFMFMCTAVALLVDARHDVHANEMGALDVSESPVDLQADSLVHNKDGQSVTASGDVVLKQDGKTVKADKIIYNLREDTVIATGHVEFIDATGDRHYAERFEFNDALKNGFVEGLKTFLVDGSRFTASNGRQVEGKKIIMKDARYTACKVCKDKPDKAPLWQIRASEVEHDKESQMVSYRNARFEIDGVPVMYMPYFAHPDGSVKRKSGFLTPSAGYKSDLGAFIENSYYWDIAPEKDLTVGLTAMSRELPLASAQWRQRWSDASLIAQGSFTHSRRTDDNNGSPIQIDRKLRGNLKADGLWNMNNKWRSGVNIDVASDDQYLRQYDFDSEDVLENQLFVERFSGRNYAVGRVLAFQDVRVDQSQREDQPSILPEIQAQFLGEPGDVPFLGGRWSLDASLLGLIRDNDGQDVDRAHTALGWERRFVSDLGFVSKVDASAQGSLYSINDRTGSQGSTTIKGNSIESRGFAYINAETSYPVVRNFEKSQMVIEPLVSAMLSPDIDTDDIPNEDSQDLQIDALGLFEPNRFPGVDGIEDQSHVTYGLRTALYAFDGSYGDLFIGQSYRFDDKENPFDVGSGLNDQSSDIVGELKTNYQDDYTLDYRFQLDNDNLSPQRHEVDASMKIANLTLSTNYLFAKAVEGSGDDETREQINNAASYYINDKWRIFGAARHDLGDDPGLRQANIGVDYLGECISWSVVGARTLTDDASGDSGTELFLRVGFKNLGEFQTSGVQLGGGSE